LLIIGFVNLQLKNYRPMGLVMAVEADKISTFREQLRSLIDEP
jgi:protein BCP1